MLPDQATLQIFANRIRRNVWAVITVSAAVVTLLFSPRAGRLNVG